MNPRYKLDQVVEFGGSDALTCGIGVIVGITVRFNKDNKEYYVYNIRHKWNYVVASDDATSFSIDEDLIINLYVKCDNKL